jgi:hypothetical protein
MGDLTDLQGVVPPVHIRELEEVPFCVTYVLPSTDYGAGFTEVIETPPGFRGKVRSIDLYNVTELFTAVTTPAYCYVGISGDTDAFCTSASLGTLAVDAADSPLLADGATHIIPANTTVHVTGVAPTGGTPAGIATTAVTILYFL